LLVDREASLVHQVIERVVREPSAPVERPDVFRAPVVDGVHVEERAALPRRPRLALETALPRTHDRAPAIEALVGADADETRCRSLAVARVPKPEEVDELLELL